MDQVQSLFGLDQHCESLIALWSIFGVLELLSEKISFVVGLTYSSR